MPIAVNDAGEAMYLSGEGQWTRAHIAENPDTKERVAWDGERWTPLASKPAGDAGVVADVVKSAGSGLVKGAIGLAGLPADAADLATRGVDYVAGAETNRSFGRPAADYAGAKALRGYVEDKVGKLYEPQTTAGKYAQTVGEFAPAAIGGPGGLATRALTRAVIPGVVSEAAGQATEGTGLEPYARVAGALGGAVAGARAASAIRAPTAAAVPSEANLRAATSGYRNPVVDALEIDSRAVATFANSVQRALERSRFSRKNPGVDEVFDQLDMLRVPEFGTSHRLMDFDSTRRRLNALASSPDGTVAGAANRVIRSIDAFTLRVPRSAVLSGDPVAAGRALFEARSNAAANFRSRRVTEAIEKAVNTAAATHSGGNLQNEIQKQLRSILNNRKMTRGMNADEIDALREAARGTALSNLTRRVAKILGGGGGLGQLATGAAGGAVFGPVGMVALPALGLAANRAGSAMTMRQAQGVAEMLRARSPLYGPQNLQDYMARIHFDPNPEVRDAALRALLLSGTSQQLAGGYGR